ncbi:hypothetical protein I546_3083 [Mycobacterium kansasii 732]|nr:hypothetical protein I546_3083 [Mycobacterium kansasii 732]
MLCGRKIGSADATATLVWHLSLIAAPADLGQPFIVGLATDESLAPFAKSYERLRGRPSPEVQCRC